MPKHTPAERLKTRIKTERERTGFKFEKTPPVKIKRGVSPPTRKTILGAGTVITVKPVSVTDVLKGVVTDKRVIQATEPVKKK